MVEETSSLEIPFVSYHILENPPAPFQYLRNVRNNPTGTFRE